MKYIFSLIILLSFISCDEPTYSRDEFLAMAKTGDPDLSIMAPKNISEVVVNCNDYSPACRYGYRVFIKRIEMVVLFYEKSENASKAAKRAQTYVARNWVLDEVKGEPILERFVVKYLKAKKMF